MAYLTIFGNVPQKTLAEHRSKLERINPQCFKLSQRNAYELNPLTPTSNFLPRAFNVSNAAPDVCLQQTACPQQAFLPYAPSYGSVQSCDGDGEAGFEELAGSKKSISLTFAQVRRKMWPIDKFQ